MISTVVVSAFMILLTATIIRLAITGRITGFNPNRAVMRTTSLHGNNAVLMLAAASLASLAVSVSANAARWEQMSDRVAPILVAGLMLAIISLVAFRSADAVMGAVGFLAELIAAGLEHGQAGALAVLVLAMLLLLLLGFVRGFVRS